MTTEQQREQHHIAISDRADEILDQRLAAGEAFSEGLTNACIEQARREIPALTGGAK